MVNYDNGKIYMIIPLCDHDENEIYIGSTTKQYLCQRMDTHRSGYKCWKNNGCRLTRSYILFEKFDIDRCDIVLIESVHANNKMELKSREAYYIQSMKCINKNIPGRSLKQWRSDNKTKQEDYNKQWYSNNKEKSSQRCKQYYEQNKTKVLQKIKCNICNCIVTKGNFKEHERTKKHQANLILFDEIEYDYQLEDGTPCSEQEYNDAIKALI